MPGNLKRRLGVLTLMLAHLAAACGPAAPAPAVTSFSPQAWPQEELERYLALQRGFDEHSKTPLEPDKSALSSNGMIAGTSEPLAVHAGLEVLQAGGNAADAALTSALTQVALAAGAAVSFAGMMTAVYYDAATRTVHTLNAGYDTVSGEKDPLTIPRLGQPSGRATLVPGFIAGVQALHDRFGTAPFAAIFDPAIWVAEHGAPVSPMLAALLVAHEKDITRLPETKRLFTREDGSRHRQGDLLRQPELARTLRQVAAQGSAYMYTGEWGHRFVDAVRREGGRITRDDLRGYRVLWSAPIELPYREYRVATLGPPNIGGTQTLASLKLADLANVKRHGHYATSPEALYDLVQISRVQAIFANSPGWVARRYFPDVDPSPASLVTDATAARIWSYIQKPGWAADALARAQSPSPGHSGAIVAVDQRGNVASLLHSCNCIGWGSAGLFVDGVSIPDAASHQQPQVALAGPGLRLPERTNPLIVMKDGAPVLASSAIGVSLQEVTLYSLLSVLDFGMDPGSAVKAPATQGPFFDIGPTGLGATEYEKETVGPGEFPEAVLDRLRARGQEVKVTPGDQQRGYWIGIWIDPRTRARVGGAALKSSAMVEGN